MLYTEFMNKVCDACIFTNEITGRSFIAPCYRLYMKEDGLDPQDVSDMTVTYNDVKEYMELEVKRRNTLLDNLPNVVDWISNLISSNVDPAIENETNEVVKDLIEYLKLKKDVEEKKSEEKQANKSNGKIDSFNFNKREI